MMKLLGDRILIKRVEGKKESAGGILIPENAVDKPQEAEVVGVGTGRVTESGIAVPMTVQVGDHVVIGRYSGTTIRVGDEEFEVIREADVLGILDSAPVTTLAEQGRAMLDAADESIAKGNARPEEAYKKASKG